MNNDARSIFEAYKHQSANIQLVNEGMLNRAGARVMGALGSVVGADKQTTKITYMKNIANNKILKLAKEISDDFTKLGIPNQADNFAKNMQAAVDSIIDKVATAPAATTAAATPAPGTPAPAAAATPGTTTTAAAPTTPATPPKRGIENTENVAGLLKVNTPPKRSPKKIAADKAAADKAAADKAAADKAAADKAAADKAAAAKKPAVAPFSKDEQAELNQLTKTPNFNRTAEQKIRIQELSGKAAAAAKNR